MALSLPDQFEVRVCAPSRLHFGLLAPAAGQPRRYGGLGAMIDRPGLRLAARHASQFAVAGPLAERAAEFARHVAAAWMLPGEPLCQLEIESAAPQHVGLGTGTQLGLAVAAAMQRLLQPSATENQSLDAAQLANWAGRAARSAIGTHGFAAGGLLFEQGKSTDEPVAPLSARLAIPVSWRFVLFWPEPGSGLSGQAERNVFAQFQAPPERAAQELERLASDEILPAVAAGDILAFGEALYRFGHGAGECFAPYQQGAFASARIAALVSHIRSLGVPGVGQSSWGPTVYALAADDAQADWLLAKVAASGLAEARPAIVASPNNRGAEVLP